MRILDRYFTGEFVRVFVFALMGFVVILSLNNIIEAIKIETTAGKSHLFLYILYTIPEVIEKVVPASLLFAVCFTVAQFTNTRELVAIRSAGISFYRVLMPAFLFGLLMVFVLFLFQNFVVTAAREGAKTELGILKKDSAVRSDVIWQRNLRGREGYYFIYYLDREKLEVYGGLNYVKFRDASTPEMMYEATEASYKKDTAEWLLKNVRVVKFKSDMRTFSVDTFPELKVKFPEDIQFFTNPSRDPASLNFLELLDEIKRRDTMGFNSIQYRVKLHANFAFPFMCVIMTMIGAVFGSMGSLRGGGPLIRSILISAGAYLINIVFFSLGENLGAGGVIPPFLGGWGPTVIFMGVTLYLSRRLKM